MDDFDRYFEKASRITEQNSGQSGSSRKGSLQNDPNKKGRSKNGESHNSESSKRNRSLHQSPHHDLNPPICLITPYEENNETSSNRNNSFYRKISNKRSSKDSQQDSLRVSLLDRHVRRHSINPEEITASKLKEINQLQQDDCLIVRSFLTSPKGLVDRGDSFKRRASNVGDRLPSAAQMLELSNSFKRRLSDASKNHKASFHGNTTAATISDLINANASATSENDDSICLEPIEKRTNKYINKRPSIEVTKCYSLDCDPPPETNVPLTANKAAIKSLLSHEMSNVVIVLGDFKVGKSSLITQFLSSEHLMGFDNYNENSFENIISIYVDGVETQLNFVEVDLKSVKTLEQIPRSAECNAYLVVYSITDSASFHTATQLVRHLCLVEETGKKDQVILGKRSYSVIMVANKGDLVRNRKVSEAEAREVCNRYECKYLEISSALSHNVNELLVGLVQQIKLNDRRRTHEGKHRKSQSTKSAKSPLSCSSSVSLLPNSSSSMDSYLRWFKKIFKIKQKDERFQCDNLHTL